MNYRGGLFGLFETSVLISFSPLWVHVVNVMLETNLDTLFLPQMDFVTVRNHHDQDSALHCLWNGFLASKPGHPFLKRIIQDVVDAQGPCTSDSLRTQSVDTGFCGLGRAVKTVLGQNPWKEFVPGLYEWDADPINFGQTLILLVRANIIEDDSP